MRNDYGNRPKRQGTERQRALANKDLPTQNTGSGRKMLKNPHRSVLNAADAALKNIVGLGRKRTAQAEANKGSETRKRSAEAKAEMKKMEKLPRAPMNDADQQLEILKNANRR